MVSRFVFLIQHLSLFLECSSHFLLCLLSIDLQECWMFSREVTMKLTCDLDWQRINVEHLFCNEYVEIWCGDERNTIISLIILNKRMESRLLICGWVRWGELCGGEEEDDNQKTLVGSAGSLVWIWIVVKYHLWTSTTSWGEVGLANRNTSTAKLEKCSLCKANTSFVFKLLQAANEYEAYNISLTCW